MINKTNNQWKKLIVTAVVVVLLLTTAMTPVKALGFADAVATIAQTGYDIYRWISDAIAEVDKYLAETIGNQILFDALDIFTQRLAVNTATSIATGGRGQNSLFEGKVFGDILEDAGNAAAGDLIGNLGKDWREQYGFDICNPRLDVKVSVAMSLLKFASPESQLARPECDLADVINNWEVFVDRYNLDNLSSSEERNKALGSLLSDVQVQFLPGKSDFAASISLNNRLIEQVDKAELEATINRLVSEFNPKTNITGTREETPSKSIEDAAGEPLEQARQDRLAKAIASANNKSILGRALSSFTNTLTAKLLQRWINDGMYKLADMKNRQTGIPVPDFVTDVVGPPGTGGYNLGGSGSSGGTNPFTQPITKQAVQSFFDEFETVTFGSPQEYDPLIDFIICPDRKDTIGLNNCVMSSKFYSAFNRNEPITVKEALDLGLLDPSLPLISVENPRNTDLQYCAKQALCYSNLQKMRLFRLIPLGWELAASISPVNNPYTIGFVAGCFDPKTTEQEGQCPTEVRKLIDPNWILEAPVAQCRAKGFGSLLQSANDIGRREVCVDTLTCLKEDDDGECIADAWGYCTREKNVWRLGGDQCNPAYASCRTFSQGREEYNYIKDTVDFCSSDEAGCRWYSTEQLPVPTVNPPVGAIPTTALCGSSRRLYPDQRTATEYCKALGFAGGNLVEQETEVLTTACQNDVDQGWIEQNNSGFITEVNCFSNDYDWDEDSKIFLNGQAGDCDESQAGCTELIKISRGVNLVQNGSFEINNSGTLAGWTAGSGSWSANNTRGYVGAFSARSASTGTARYLKYQLTNLTPGLTYTASAYIYADEDTGGGGISSPSWQRFGLVEKAVAAVEDPNAPTIGRLEVVDFAHQGTDQTGVWDRVAVTFTATSNSAEIRLVADQKNVYFDAVQVERSTSSNTYAEYGAAPKTYIKKAPAYLNCDNPALASPECGIYAPSCEADEVGCEAYKPINGDPSVNGVVGGGDYCPSQCNGYTQYRESLSTVEDLFNDDTATGYNPYINFIADTAQSCTLADAGCEEFTDITNTENKLYFKSLRMCADNSDPNVDTYYTWEGSDTTGYQLKVWRLLRSDVDAGPCTNVSFNDTLGKNICIDGDVGIDDCDGDEGDLTCRSYTDSNNEEHLRREFKVIKGSDSCTKVRRTVDLTDLAMILPTESGSCTAAVNGCHEYKGNSGSNIRRVFISDFESGAQGWTGSATTLSSEAGSIGGHSLRVNDSRLEKESSFSSGRSYTISFWAKKVSDFGAGFTLSMGIEGIDETFADGEFSFTTEWQRYEFGPVYYNPGGVNQETLYIDLDTSYYIDNIILKEITADLYLIKDSWNTPDQCAGYDGCQAYQDRDNNTHFLYNFGSLCRSEAVGCEAFVDTKNTGNATTQNWPMGNNLENGGFEDGLAGFEPVYVDPNSADASYVVTEDAAYSGSRSLLMSGINGGGIEAQTENISVRGDQKYYYAARIKAENLTATSSNAPSIFLRFYTATGTPIGSSWQGVIRTTAGTYDWKLLQGEFTTPVTAAFARVGIGMNQANTGIIYWDDIRFAETIITGADEITYLVDDENYYCSAAFKGCSALGNPKITYSEEGVEEIDGWDKTYKINNPDRYDLILCGQNALGCEEFQSEGSTIYLRDPGDRTCTYVSGYEYGGVSFPAGWYKSYSINEDNLVSCNGNGQNPALVKTNSTAYDGWVGACVPEASGCTEFVDPQGTQGIDLVFNGTFENDYNNDKKPDFWFNDPQPASGTWVWDNKGIDNSYAFRYEYSPTSGLKQEIKKLKAGKTYVVSWSVKPISNKADFKVTLDCAGSPVSSPDKSFDQMSSSSLSYLSKRGDMPSNEYSHFSAKMKISDDNSSDTVCTLRFGSVEDNSPSLSVYVDNIKVQLIQSYYYINNNAISGSNCNGQVSWEEGCVLVQDTSQISLSTGDPSYQFNSSASYRSSQQSGNILKPAVTCSAGEKGCDTNRIIQVTAGRECGEWITCTSWAYYQDLNGQTQKACYDLGRCVELNPDDPSNCLVWATSTDEYINDTTYKTRDITWSGRDYSGYSVPGIFPIDTLATKNYGDSSSSDWRLTAFDNLGNDRGGIGPLKNEVLLRCRLFPEADSPFAYVSGLGVVYDDKGNISQRPISLSKANFCQPGKNCECDYIKAEYTQGEIRYQSVDVLPTGKIDYTDYGLYNDRGVWSSDGVSYNTNDMVAYQGIKWSAIKQHNSSTANYPGHTEFWSQIVTNISDLKKTSEYRGWWGFCLEEDLSRQKLGSLYGNHPCSTWMPLDLISGDFNIMSASSGINWPDTAYYCAISNGVPSVTYDLNFHAGGQWAMKDDVVQVINYTTGTVSGLSGEDYSLQFYSNPLPTDDGLGTHICLPDISKISNWNGPVPDGLDEVAEFFGDPEDMTNKTVVFNLKSSVHEVLAAIDKNYVETETNSWWKRLFGRALADVVTNPHLGNSLPSVVTLDSSNALTSTNQLISDGYDDKSENGANEPQNIWRRCYGHTGLVEDVWTEISQEECASILGTYKAVLKFYVITDYEGNDNNSVCKNNNGAPMAGVVLDFIDYSAQDDFTLGYQYQIQLRRLDETFNGEQHLCTDIAKTENPRATSLLNGPVGFIYPKNQGAYGWYGRINMADDLTQYGGVYIRPSVIADTTYAVRGNAVGWDGQTYTPGI
ncbi:MAG: hypothetical protein NUV82_04210, partial [Candidatus Komeilibacteria bacterium]|nr:hypothetical protein [Candidatus Komeilibacteria bacterium]